MLWLGKVGALAQLPSPRRGLDATWERASTVARTIGGGQVVSFAPGGRRTLKPQWAALPYATYATLEEFYTGQRGPGPWVVLDSARRNHLSRNQSSAGSADSDASGFSVASDSGEWVTSTADMYLRGPRSIRWTLPAAVLSGILELDPPAGLVGVPAPSGQPWTWSGSVSLAGLVASVSVTPALSWRRIDGSQVSVTTGTPVSAVPGAWTAYSVSLSAPPAGAVAVRAQLRVAPGVLTTAAILPAAVAVTPPLPARSAAPLIVSSLGRIQHGGAARRPSAGAARVIRAPITTTDVLIDQPMLDMYASVRAWAPGTGVPQCSWTHLTDVATWVDHRMPIEAVLIEVG